MDDIIALVLEDKYLEAAKLASPKVRKRLKNFRATLPYMSYKQAIIEKENLLKELHPKKDKKHKFVSVGSDMEALEALFQKPSEPEVDRYSIHAKQVLTLKPIKRLSVVEKIGNIQIGDIICLITKSNHFANLIKVLNDNEIDYDQLGGSAVVFRDIPVILLRSKYYNHHGKMVGYDFAPSWKRKRFKIENTISHEQISKLIQKHTHKVGLYPIFRRNTVLIPIVSPEITGIKFNLTSKFKQIVDSWDLNFVG